MHSPRPLAVTSAAACAVGEFRRGRRRTADPVVHDQIPKKGFIDDNGKTVVHHSLLNAALSG
jgi:hypothetical protein